MSDSRGYEELSVASNGVHVTKRFEEAQFPVPAIAFELRSHREEDVRVVLSDTVPEAIAVEDLGFHPEYGSEHWVIDDESTIVFERDLAPEESYTTVYGIRATGSDDIAEFLTEPTLVEVDPPLPDGESSPVLPESEDDGIREAIGEEGEIPAPEPDADDADDPEKLELNNPDRPADGRETNASRGLEGSVVAAVAEEIRQGQASTEDVTILREALVADEESGTTAAKVDQIQEDVADLRAYTGALEEFLGDNGTAQQILDELEGQIDSFEDRLSSLDSTVQDNSERLESVTATVDGFDETIQSLGADVDEFEDTLATLESDLTALETTVSDQEIAQRIDELESDINDLRSWQEQIVQTFGG